MNKKVISAMLAASMAVSLAACGSTATSEATSAVSSETSSTVASGESAASGSYTGTPIKVGGIGPITGAAATYGNAVKNAEELAVKEINAANGSDVFDWKFEDDEHDAEKSVNAYNSLKDWGMQMLVGPTTTGASIAVSSVVNEDRTFMLTPSGSSTDNQYIHLSYHITFLTRKCYFLIHYCTPFCYCLMSLSYRTPKRAAMRQSTE